MWYYMIKYSFDPTKFIRGPFKTEEEAYVKMKDEAYNEYNIAIEESNWEPEIYEDEEFGEITIAEYCRSNRELTEFFTFKI